MRHEILAAFFWIVRIRYEKTAYGSAFQYNCSIRMRWTNI